MSDPGSIEETIFVAARELSRPEERAAYLNHACGDDRALRERVERMLNAEKKADQFLAGNPLQLDRASPIAGSESVGSMIGCYKLLQQIGEGGCGIVFMAEQEQPIRRRVALKVIKPGMDTRQVIARFEAERQALAMMDHPNIARVLDAGATENARPYFVMELVRGVRITDYCDQNNLSTRERLDLFIKVVQAVQHAHQKGIIHRDLKPSNVLVTLHDGEPVPKVIDFGIAKALEQKLTDKTLFTQFEQFLGTPAYTSPEQAEMSGLDIDTRSDIYSLGVLLYELLVGQTPFDARELVRSGLDDMRRIIREKEPARPSTRLSTMLAEERTATAQRRAVSSPQLIHLLKGDLDWIVMKCLEKDRTRRYETANGLARDIEHYLGNEPVTARPPSAVYRMSKLVQRNKLAVAAVVAVTLALVGGIVVSTWQAVRAQRAELVAKEEKESAEAVLKFVRDKILSAGRPEGQEGGLGKDVTLRQALDAAEAEIENSFTNRPLVEASIRKRLGESYKFLGEPALAVKQLERALQLRWQALGADHQSTFSVMSSLTDAGGPKANLPVVEEALRLRTAKLGPEHPETLKAMHVLALMYVGAGEADKAVPLYEATLKLRRERLGPNDPETLLTMHNLARAYVVQRETGKGLNLLREALQLQKASLPPDDRLTLMTMQNLAATLAKNRNLDEAIPIYEEWHRLLEAKFGREHPETLIGADELAKAYADAGRRNEAIALWEEVLELQKARLGPEHPDTGTTMFRLANAYWQTGKRAESVQLDEQALKLRRAKLGAHHPDTLDSMLNLASGYREFEKLDQAEALYREYLEHRRDSLTPRFQLASILMERAKTNTANPRGAHRFTEADQLLRDYVARARSRYTNDVSKLEESLNKAAELRFRHGLFAEAESLHCELIQSLRAQSAPERGRLMNSLARLGRLYTDWAWADRTNVLARNGRGHVSSVLQPASAALPTADVSLATSAPCDRAFEAERLLRDCLAWHLDGTNAAHWRVADVRSRLGGALVSVAVTDLALDAATREARLVEAETLLLEGHERLQGRTSMEERKYKRDALERLTRLYEAWGKLDQRADWQQQLEDFHKTKSKTATAAEVH